MSKCGCLGVGCANGREPQSNKQFYTRYIYEKIFNEYPTATMYSFFFYSETQQKRHMKRETNIIIESETDQGNTEEFTKLSQIKQLRLLGSGHYFWLGGGLGGN